MNKYHGSTEELQSLIIYSGISIHNTTDTKETLKIVTNDGAVLTWYKSKGTLLFQGKQDARSKLQDIIQEKLENPSINISIPDSNKVFIVHGHDHNSLDQLELILHKLGLDPFVLQNTAGGGLTLIEALVNEIVPSDNAARFGIVLLTPDDMGYAVCDGEQCIQPRARQNVVLEMGMLIAAIGKEHVAILKKGDIEIPSDAKGIIYTPFTDRVKETVPKLAERLCDAGFDISRDSIIKASS